VGLTTISGGRKASEKQKVIVMRNSDKDKVAAELRKHYSGKDWLGEIIEAFEDHHEGMYQMFINQHKDKILLPHYWSVEKILKPLM
jgi:hypothetical protein